LYHFALTPTSAILGEPFFELAKSVQVALHQKLAPPGAGTQEVYLQPLYDDASRKIRSSTNVSDVNCQAFSTKLKIY
jgi:hypothetical protein